MRAQGIGDGDKHIEYSADDMMRGAAVIVGTTPRIRQQLQIDGCSTAAHKQAAQQTATAARKIAIRNTTQRESMYNGGNATRYARAACDGSAADA